MKKLKKALLVIASLLALIALSIGSALFYTIHRSDTDAAQANTAAVQAFKAQQKHPSQQPTAAHQSTKRDKPDPSPAPAPAKPSLSSLAPQGVEVEALLSGDGLDGEVAVVKGQNQASLQSIADEGFIAHYGNSGSLDSTTKGTVSVLAAHRNTHGALFHRIPDLAMGDRLTLELPDGSRRGYQVVKTAAKLPTVDDTSFYTVPADLPKSGHYIVLLTCGEWLTDERHIVILELSADR